MITRTSLTKWILSDALLLALAVHPVSTRDTSVCCYADALSEISIIRDKSLTDEQRKVHYQKLDNLRKERQKKNTRDTSSVRDYTSVENKDSQK